MSAVPRTPADAIRPMDETDLAQVLRVERRSYQFPWTEAVFRDCMRVGYACWVRQEDGLVAGYLIMSMAAGEAHVLNLCVDRGFRRRGYGQELLEHAITTAERMAAETVFLEVRPSNTPALELYMRLGFSEVGTRPGYYPAHGGQREDGLILARPLAAPAWR